MKSKRVLTWAAVVLLAVLSTLPAADPAAAQNRPGSSQGKPEFIADELLVAFKAGTPADRRAAAHSQAGGRVVRQIRSLGVDVVKVQGPAERRLQAYQNHPLVEVAELNGIAYAEAWPTDGSPNDTEFENREAQRRQWALHNVDPYGGKIDADIDAPEAWRTTTGASTTVAIIDTGVSDHADLPAFKSPGAPDPDRVDYAADGQNDAFDAHGHGTHVAGTVAARTNNGVGVAGVCPDCKIISARVCGPDGSCNYDWIVSGVLWAVGCEDRAADPPTDFGVCREGTQRAKVLNISLGGTYSSTVLQRAIKRAWERGAVIACAAGNNNNTIAFYPAAFPECIAVAATDNRDQKASFSNFGGWVDVSAPGVSIMSTVRTGGYEAWSGTSMASPHVAGLAALVWANGASDPQSVRNAIESSVVKLGGNARNLGKGRISACRALKRTDCGSI